MMRSLGKLEWLGIAWSALGIVLIGYVLGAATFKYPLPMNADPGGVLGILSFFGVSSGASLFWVFSADRRYWLSKALAVSYAGSFLKPALTDLAERKLLAGSVKFYLLLPQCNEDLSEDELEAAYRRLKQRGLTIVDTPVGLGRKRPGSVKAIHDASGAVVGFVDFPTMLTHLQRMIELQHKSGMSESLEPKVLDRLVSRYGEKFGEEALALLPRSLKLFVELLPLESDFLKI